MESEVATCEHGLQVGLPNTSDPRECQECDFCPSCNRVTKFTGEFCSRCGYEWGTH